MTTIALITGASRGLGRNTALNIARRGGDVIITYHSRAQEAQAVVAEIEALGEEVRDKVKAHSGVALEWEIQRVGISLPSRMREGAGGGPALSTSDAAGDGGRPPLGPLPQAGGEEGGHAAFFVHR